jgi:hypothetical protein
MRLLVCCALALMAAEFAFAGTPERDQAWDLLIAEAKKHGGGETQYKTSTSYVFQRPDGSFVTFTRMLDKGTRAVCVISQDQNVTICGNWETGKLLYGWRADAGSSWTYSDTPPDTTAAEEKGPLASLLASLGDLIEMGSSSALAHWHLTSSGFSWVKGRLRGPSSASKAR